MIEIVCPFCRCNKIRRERNPRLTKMWRTVCVRCDAMGPPARTYGAALALWRRGRYDQTGTLAQDPKR